MEYYVNIDDLLLEYYGEEFRESKERIILNGNSLLNPYFNMLLNIETPLHQVSHYGKIRYFCAESLPFKSRQDRVFSSHNPTFFASARLTGVATRIPAKREHKKGD